MNAAKPAEAGLEHVGTCPDSTTKAPSIDTIEAALALSVMSQPDDLEGLVGVMIGVEFTNDLAGRIFWAAVLGHDEFPQSMSARPPTWTVAELLGENVVDVAFVGDSHAFRLAVMVDQLVLAHLVADAHAARCIRRAALSALSALAAGRRVDAVAADLARVVMS